MAAIKVQVTLDEELMQRADAYADANYMSRSGLVSVALTDYLNAKQVTTSISEMAICLRKIADKGIVDKETMEKLEDIERAFKFIIGK